MRADGTRIDLAALRDRPLAAMAAIARPERFFAMLRERGLAAGREPSSCRTITISARCRPDSIGLELVCTEKDAVKLWMLRPDAWAVPLEVEVEPAFWSAFDRLLDAKLSSRHGRQTS